MNEIERALDLIDAVVYADLFDCAVTAEELWRFSRVAIGPDELHEELGDSRWKDVLTERDGYYCLTGREHLLDRRPERRGRARRLLERAKGVVGWLQYAPFVRGALVTGSVAADDAEPDADIDLLVLVAPERIGLVFLLMGSLSSATSRKFFCPNYYLSADRLGIARHTHYVAREIAQATSLVEPASCLRDANPWVLDQLPNATVRANPARKRSVLGALQRFLEAPLRGRLGDRLESKARDIALKRLQHHHGLAGRPVPDRVVSNLNEGIELRFHESQRLDAVDEKYRTLRREIARRLEEHTMRHACG